MGAEAKTTVRIGDVSYAGTALLETDELIFRGEMRLRIGLGDIRAASVAKGVLRVEHAGGVASLADTVIFAAASAAGLTYTKVVRVSETDTAEKLVIPRAAR